MRDEKSFLIGKPYFLSMVIVFLAFSSYPGIRALRVYRFLELLPSSYNKFSYPRLFVQFRIFDLVQPLGHTPRQHDFSRTRCVIYPQLLQTSH